jgi:hypothetical protein
MYIYGIYVYLIMISKEEILRIAEDYQKTVRDRIDQLLFEDANMYTNLGSDSTKADKEEVKKNSRAIYRAIKDLDESTGKLLLQHQDGY